jgi:hypothetical protein
VDIIWSTVEYLGLGRLWTNFLKWDYISVLMEERLTREKGEGILIEREAINSE